MDENNQNFVMEAKQRESRLNHVLNHMTQLEGFTLVQSHLKLSKKLFVYE